MGESKAAEKLIGRSEVAVVSNPEFLREGYAIYDSLHPERIVVGAREHHVAERVAKLFGLTNAPVVVTNNVSSIKSPIFATRSALTATTC